MNNIKNSIKWADWSWNPVTGCLGPNGVTCQYCYAKRIAERFRGSKAFPNGFEPTWHPERLDEPFRLRKPSRIFVGSITDMFGEWVTWPQMSAVMDVMRQSPLHTFYLLTKQPDRIMSVLARAPGHVWPLPNVWLGASIDTQARARDTYEAMYAVRAAGWHTLVSAEPILEWIDPRWFKWAEWIIVGAQSGRDAAKHRPEREWILSYVEHCSRWGYPLFLKSSITALWPDLTRREWPEVVE